MEILDMLNQPKEGVTNMQAQPKQNQEETFEYLVIIRDKHMSTGYAYDTKLLEAIKKAKGQLGAKEKDIVGKICYRYPARYKFTINHFPILVSFQDENNGNNVDLNLVTEIKL
jgi:hypothetical protein